MEDLHLEQIMHDNRKFAVISIDQEKWISLYNINIDTLDPSNFIFASDEAQATCDLAFSQEFGYF